MPRTDIANHPARAFREAASVEVSCLADSRSGRATVRPDRVRRSLAMGRASELMIRSSAGRHRRSLLSRLSNAAIGRRGLVRRSPR
jgi:hypothetical protein